MIKCGPLACQDSERCKVGRTEEGGEEGLELIPKRALGMLTETQISFNLGVKGALGRLFLIPRWNSSLLVITSHYSHVDVKWKTVTRERFRECKLREIKLDREEWG